MSATKSSAPKYAICTRGWSSRPRRVGHPYGALEADPEGKPGRAGVGEKRGDVLDLADVLDPGHQHAASPGPSRRLGTSSSKPGWSIRLTRTNTGTAFVSSCTNPGTFSATLLFANLRHGAFEVEDRHVGPTARELAGEVRANRGGVEHRAPVAGHRRRHGG